MDQKFTDYDWEQLLEEDSFISWMLKNENNEDWEKLIVMDPEFAKKVEKAKNIFFLLQEKNEVLDEAAVQSMWVKTEQFEQEVKRSERKRIIYRTIRIAASIFLIFSLGTLAFYYFSSDRGDYQFTATDLQESSEAHIVLSTGEKINLSSENSKILLDDEEHQLVVNDSIIHLENKVRPEKKDVSMNEVVMPYGRQTEITLADGTVVWLNAGSKLAFPSAFTENKRKVYLEGEACFQVVKDESKPFIVNAGEVDVKVLGTFFNVSAYADQETIEAVLIRGSVAVNKPGKFKTISVELSPNEKAAFNKLDKEISVTAEPNAERYVAWVNGWLEYRRESLNSVLIKLERYYDVKFHLPPSFPADDKISGKLDLKESLENVMVVLSDAAQIEFTIEGKEIYIQRKDNS